MFNRFNTITQKFSPNLLKIISNAGWLVADRLLRMGLGLIVGVWVARYLGPSQFGLFNYAVAFVALFGSPAGLGLDQIVIRDILRFPLDKEKILGTAFTLKLLSGFVAVGLAIAAISRLQPNATLTQWLVGITALSLIFQSFDVIDFWYQSQVQSKYTVFAKNASLILASCAKVLLIQLGAPLIMFVWVFTAEFALNALALSTVYQFKGHFFKAWRFSLHWAKKLLKDSWTLIFSAFMIIIYMRTDQIMLGQMAGAEAVGIYSAATRISEIWYFIPGAFTSSVFSSIVAARQIDSELYAQRVQKVLDFLSMLSCIMVIGVVLLSSQLVGLLYGEEYLEAAPVLAIHIWTGFFVASGVMGNLWMITEGLMPVSLVTTAIGAVVNIVLNYYLIQSNGTIGAAISTLIAQFFSAYLGNILFVRTRPLFIMQTKAFILPAALGRLATEANRLLKG